MESYNSSCLLFMLHEFVHVPSCLLLPTFFFFFPPSEVCFVPVTLYPLVWTPVHYYLIVGCDSPFPAFLLRSFPHEVGQPVDKDFTLDSSVGHLSGSWVLFLFSEI